MSRQRRRRGSKLASLLGNEEPHILRAISGLQRIGTLASWSIAAAVVGAVVASGASVALAVLPAAVAALSVAIRVAASENAAQLQFALSGFRLGAANEDPNPGDCLPLACHPAPMGSLSTYLIGDVLSISGQGGTARILSEPLHNRQLVHRDGGKHFWVRKGDVVQFYRERDDSEVGVISAPVQEVG